MKSPGSSSSSNGLSRFEFVRAGLGWLALANMSTLAGYLQMVGGRGPRKRPSEKTGRVTGRYRSTGSEQITPYVQQIRMIVILVNFSDYGDPPWTPGFIEDMYFGATAPSVTDHFNRSSWGRMQVIGDVCGWYPIDMLSTEHSQDKIQRLAREAAAADGVVLSNYTHQVYVFPKTTSYIFGGTSHWPGDVAWMNFDPVGCAEASGKSTCQFFHVFPHELGHNLGWDHAGTLACTDAGGNKVVLSNTSTFATLGDQFDDMGCCTPSLFSTVRRLQAGWIPLTQLETITETGTYTITPYNDQSSNVYRLGDGTGQYLYFENRAAAEPPIWTAWPDGNLLIRRCPDIDPAAYTQPMTELLYGQPNSPAPNVKGLPVGQGFTLPNAPVTVTNQSWDGTNNTLEVTFA